MVKPAYIPSRGTLSGLILIPLVDMNNHIPDQHWCSLIQPTTKKTNLVVVCPITSQSTGYPFEVLLQEKKFTGTVLADHVRSLDWNMRNARFIQKAPMSVNTEVEAKLSALLFG